MDKKTRRALRPDRQAFDEIRITTIPRFKTSGLSGDEWRISARIAFFRKGEIVHEDSARDVKSAAQFLAWKYAVACDEGIGRTEHEYDRCDQEGCAELATVILKMKKVYCSDPHAHGGHEPKEYEGVYRYFCTRHSKRGDSSFDDSDANYEIVEGTPGDPDPSQVNEAIVL